MTDGMITRRNVITGIAMMGAGGVASARPPMPYAKKMAKGTIDKLIPAQIGDWTFETTSGLVLPPPDATIDRLYDEVMTRVYVRPNSPPIMFLIAYGSVQDGLLQLHRPEVCYPVGGYELSETRIAQFPIMPGNDVPIRTFTAASDSRVEQVMYWTRVGNVLPTSWGEQRWAVVEANLKGAVPDGILVRMSTVDLDMEASMEILQSFAQSLAQAVKPDVRRLLWQGTA
jgi:EpsI family protein